MGFQTFEIIVMMLVELVFYIWQLLPEVVYTCLSQHTLLVIWLIQTDWLTDWLTYLLSYPQSKDAIASKKYDDHFNALLYQDKI